MSRNPINYLGFENMNDIDKDEIKRIYLVSKKTYHNIEFLLNEVKNLDDLDYGFNNWLIREQKKQLKSSKSRGRVLSVMSATGHGITKRKKKRKPRKKKSVKKRKGKSKKKRVRKGGKSRRRS